MKNAIVFVWSYRGAKGRSCIRDLGQAWMPSGLEGHDARVAFGGLAPHSAKDTLQPREPLPTKEFKVDAIEVCLLKSGQAKGWSWSVLIVVIQMIEF